MRICANLLIGSKPNWSVAVESGGVLRMLAQNDLEREKYEARLKYQRDEAARMRYAAKLAEDAEKRGEEPK